MHPRKIITISTLPNPHANTFISINAFVCAINIDSHCLRCRVSQALALFCYYLRRLYSGNLVALIKEYKQNWTLLLSLGKIMGSKYECIHVWSPELQELWMNFNAFQHSSQKTRKVIKLYFNLSKQNQSWRNSRTSQTEKTHSLPLLLHPPLLQTKVLLPWGQK